MVKPSTHDPEPPHPFECQACGHRIEAEAHPGTCPECGGTLRNLARPRPR